MKKLIYSIVFLGMVLFAAPSVAQVSIQMNIGSQPQWGPSGYDYVRYYYMPEYDIYYDVQHRRYAYWDYNRWVLIPVLPARYAHVNLYQTYKVVLNNPNPWLQHNYNRKQYHHYASSRKQVNIRDYKDRYANKDVVRVEASGTVRATQKSKPTDKGRLANVNSTVRPSHSSKR